MLLFGSFVLLLIVFVLEAMARFRAASTEGRHLIFWVVSLWFVFVVNSLTGIILTQPSLLLVFWVLMLLPMTVRSEKQVATRPDRAPSAIARVVR